MPPLAAVPDLESELDDLYGLPLEDFTRARNDLAARLKRARQDDAAAEVRALKKPTAAAWAANLLARDEPDSIAALVEASDELRRVQQRALDGRAGPAEVGEAAAAERDAARALVVAARRKLEARAPAPLLERLGQTLRAAAADPHARTLLARGRLSEELRPVGFGGLEPVARPKRRRDELAGAARERVAALRAEAKQLAGEAQEAERAAVEAERAAAVLRGEAEQKRSDAERAASSLADAEENLRVRR